jgi:predicted nucleic acid-binding protein
MIIDTDIVVDYLRGSDAARDWLAGLGRRDRAVSVVTHMELLEGCRSKAERAEVRRLLVAEFGNVHGLSTAIGETALALMERYRPAIDLRMADALIAATCLVQQDRLATGNVKHFEGVAGLRVVLPGYREA